MVSAEGSEIQLHGEGNMAAVLLQPPALVGEPLQMQSQHLGWGLDQNLLGGIAERNLDVTALGCRGL